MKSLFLIATALISVITANKVVHLTADNFDAIVDGTRNVFVKFEASWCGPCKRMAPIMDKVAAESFPNLDGETILAAIDADAESEIGDRFEIEAFPTVKLFLKGRNPEDAVEFQGDRTAEKITEFINTYVALNQENLPAEYKDLKPEIPLTKLLQEFAKVGPAPKPTKNGVINFNNFAAGFMDTDSESDGFYYKSTKNAKPAHKNLKQKKIKNKKDKVRSRKQVETVQVVDSAMPLVDAATAQATIKSAGSKPVILIFFSPSNNVYNDYILFIYSLFSV